MRVKICGLREPAAVEAAVAAGAAYIGFVFFPRSPRAVDPETARALAIAVPPGIAKVGLFVDPDDTTLDTVLDRVPLDIIQLHGHETPARVAEIKARHGLPVMKAIGVREASDLDAVDDFATVADQLLIDAKPPEGAVLPGGNGLAFDWQLLAGRSWPVPWLLAGGLTPQNAAEAAQRTGATQLDVSLRRRKRAGREGPRKGPRFLAGCRRLTATAERYTLDYN